MLTPGFESLAGRTKFQGTQEDNLDCCLALKKKATSKINALVLFGSEEKIYSKDLELVLFCP